MKRISTLALCAALLALAACSDSDDTKKKPQVETAAPAQQAPAQQSAMPPGHQQLSPAQRQALAAAQGLPKRGTVLEMMHAAGYTYMKIDTGNGEPIWIAATMMRVQPNDKVQWADAAVMRNFTSKSLHRTFDRILFVSNASVID